jgi:hypothetical protein
VAQIWSKIWLCHRSGAQFLAMCHADNAIKKVALGTALGVPLYAKRLDRYCLKPDYQTRMSGMCIRVLHAS